ncbi:MAG: Swt1 family HEPN domain-containing protein, partial [Chloroflexota bacterium]|nr:Swt1 family HEPN domain-containing protein [Chloroflexota bacterium]
MAITNHERVGRALELLNRGLQPFIERELRAAYKERGQVTAQGGLRGLEQMSQSRLRAPLVGGQWDTQALLGVIEDEWRTVFDRKLGRADRTLVHELRDTRNRWAHQNPFSGDDVYRALDSAQRLLQSVAAAEEAAELDREKQDLLRTRFAEQARRETRKLAVTPLEGQPAASLRPWREIVTPHPDVASGRYQQAEFAADLSQVVRGEGADEYCNPRDFFARTYLTEGLRHLLTNALCRLNGAGGDPVIKLQTNFGGGKTHSMLALYHLCAGVPAGELPGIEPLLAEADVVTLPRAARATLVGTALSPGRTHRKPDGSEVHTLWGELAWQLLGAEGYALVAEDDQRGVSPGSHALGELLAFAGPCLILIDEWLAYVRQLYGVPGLPAGSFDANMSFAQALTEAVKGAPQALLVASIPASDIEIGGEGGREALVRLENTFGRIESVWRPATAEEGFEIVRRRLFQPIAAPGLFAQRDAAVRAFATLYRDQAQEFPSACREGDYERRMQAAYPIHPELFDRLYTDWSALDRFQRTRGVLRLMAAVIHTLWERNDSNLLILPASVPIDDPAVSYELTRYMDDPWAPVLEKDVDGPHSLPLRLDRENPNLGRYSACRRVARTLYLGSAPTLHSANKGLEDRQIKLGCVQPGESVATFGDALRRLSDNANHLYLDGKRYWFATQPSVTRLAQDRAAQQHADDVREEIEKRLRMEAAKRGDFAKVHACPPSGADVPDEREARLVILSPATPHAARDAASPARQAAEVMLDSRGSAPRRYR